jgi:peptide/nickel transport system substrate-binding protein
MPRLRLRTRGRVALTLTLALALLAPFASLWIGAAEAGETAPVASPGAHAIAMHGEPKFAAGFSHFPYADPAAPKGGRVVLGQTGSFDSLNPLIIRGEPAAGIREWVYETLMARGLDEAFTMYGLIARTAEVPADRSSVTFHLDPAARFSDGHRITADDVIFSMETLRERGRPNHRNSYKKVQRTERLSDHAVRFVFDASGDREMPLIMASMPVLPQHLLTAETFDRTTLVPIVGSGPYTIAAVDAGRSITYRRNPDYWGRDLPVNRGRFNFDEIRYEYFRDMSVQFEAFKSGVLGVRTEDDPKLWSAGYDIPARRDGRILTREFETGLPAGMSAFAFNIRRPVFQDPRIRQGLLQLFNFAWVNKTLYHGLYKRTESFFERSYLSSAGRPADARERELLAPFPGAVLEEVMEGRYRMPVSDGTGHDRQNAREAFRLFGEAGYVIEGGRLVHKDTKAQLQFEILAGSSVQQRLIASFVADLAKLGIGARLRVVDSAQYQSRLKDYDYDMIQTAWPSSLSPGNEQVFRWDSRTADMPGSFNFVGVRNPAVDAMIKRLLEADTNEDFTSAVRALDRVLLSGHYVIPLFHASRQWVAHWKQYKGPATTPLWGYNLDTWWYEGQS